MAIVPDLSGNSPVGTGREEHLPSPSELEVWASTNPVLNTRGPFDDAPENTVSRYQLIADRPCVWSVSGETEAALEDTVNEVSVNTLIISNPDKETDASLGITISLVDHYGNESDTEITIAVGNEPEVPSAFTVGMWTITDEGDGSGATLEILSLPTAGDSAIDLIEYSLDDGENWTTIGTYNGVDTYLIDLDVDTGYSMIIRASNSVGAGEGSDTKTFDVTTT